MLGLKNGDVVQGIDGRIIKSPEDVLEMYKKFKLGSQVALQIMRNNEQKIIKLQIQVRNNYCVLTPLIHYSLLH